MPPEACHENAGQATSRSKSERWFPAGGAGISLDTAERVGGSKCRNVSALMLSPFHGAMCVGSPTYGQPLSSKCWVSMEQESLDPGLLPFVANSKWAHSVRYICKK